MFVTQPQNIAREHAKIWATDERVRIKVNVSPVNQVVIGHLVPRGEHELEVPRSFLPIVEGMVETDADGLKQAKRVYDRRRAEWVAGGKSETSCPFSVEAEFYSITGRSVKPLTSCVVVEDGIAPPLTVEQKLAANLVKASAEPEKRTRSK